MTDSDPAKAGSNKVKTESKEDRFARLSRSRVSALRDKLNQLGNLANRRHYSFSQEQVEKMFDDIEDELQRTKDKFAKALSSQSQINKPS